MNKQTKKPKPNPLSFVVKEGNQDSSFKTLILKKSSLKDAELNNSNRLREPQQISQHKKIINQELKLRYPQHHKTRPWP